MKNSCLKVLGDTDGFKSKFLLLLTYLFTSHSPRPAWHSLLVIPFLNMFAKSIFLLLYEFSIVITALPFTFSRMNEILTNFSLLFSAASIALSNKTPRILEKK